MGGRVKLKAIAFDLSLTATGYATPEGAGLLKPHLMDGLERLQWIRDNVLRLAADAALVIVEGYSFGSGNRAHHLGELGGIVRLAVYEAKHALVVIPPHSRAKYATGKGNAAKEAVLVEAVKRLQYAGYDHNEADAMWLLQMAGDHYATPWRISMPSEHRAALKKIDWPDLSKPRR